jgi:hypothetical protein
VTYAGFNEEGVYEEGVYEQVFHEHVRYLARSSCGPCDLPSMLVASSARCRSWGDARMLLEPRPELLMGTCEGADYGMPGRDVA